MRTPAIILTLTLLGATAISRAQDSVAIMFPDAGEREVWSQTGLPTAPPTDSVRTGAATLNFSFAGKKPGDLILVWDKRNGNLASRTIKDVKAEGTWNVASGDFKDLALVKVRVEHAGQPIAAAQVTLNDGRRSQNQLLDPSTKGEVEFFDVKPGQIKVTAQYRVKGGGSKSLTQILDAPLTRSEPVPTMTISVPEDVETAASGASSGNAAKPGTTDAPGTATSPSSADKTEVAAADKPNPVGSMVVYLIGLAVAIGVGYLLYRYAQQNKSLVEDKLKQFGVDIPQPGNDPGPLDPIAPVAPPKPEPPQKIILDDAAPDLIGSPVAMVAGTPGQISLGGAPSAAPTGEPRLVSDTGDAMPLPEGETTVGREVGLGLSLVGETTVSRRHAQLVRSGGEVSVSDLGSTNGTFVNGAQVQGSTVLRPGDAVQFGAVRFRYEG